MTDVKPVRTVCLPFPLRPGYLAQVLVPADMTRAEANRLEAFIMSLAQPDPKPKEQA